MMKSLVQRWTERLRGAATSPTAQPGVQLHEAAVEPQPERLFIDEAMALRTAFAAEWPLAAEVTDEMLRQLQGADLAALARRSPSLAGYDWSAYLRCSVCRLVRFQRAATEYAPAGGRVLDFGSYFGNAALVLRKAGFAVDAIDSYREYGDAMSRFVELQRGHGIRVHDFADGATVLDCFGPAMFDAVVCGGVIEHIPHTPRLLLDSLTALLKPGGVLILDTPNLAYLYKRLALLEGGSVFAPIEQQFYTELPFEGHHREYTVAEVEWMVRAAGLDLCSIETFNYSNFEQKELTGEHVAYYRAMQSDPLLREVIIAVARRPTDV